MAVDGILSGKGRLAIARSTFSQTAKPACENIQISAKRGAVIVCISVLGHCHGLRSAFKHLLTHGHSAEVLSLPWYIENSAQYCQAAISIDWHKNGV